ncbi:uncharacterized protein LOC121368479 [Gigantopelta aegis]|uniref:uncharacterized protein LOC121368479 n=1 Tax=Gigantopelta aegis TaxID=1735272 RepID=UPI001B887543|nr:uncharacterized protein LOC121368479 [Gigantopelta aegis]
MLSELSAGNKQRMNTIKHELKLKLKEIETQRKRTMEVIDSETKLLSIELAQAKPQAVSFPEQPILRQSSVPYLTSNQQTLTSRFRQRTPVSRSADEFIPYGRSNSDLIHTNNASNAETIAYYSRGTGAGQDINRFYPKRVNQYTSEYRRKVSELNASRHHGDNVYSGKTTLLTPGLNQYLRVHSSTLNSGVPLDPRSNKNARRSSESHPLTPGVASSKDGISPNGDEYGTNWVLDDDQRAKTASGITCRKSSSILLPSLDAPSRNYQSRDERAPKSLCIGRTRNVTDQNDLTPRPPSCRGYNLKNLTALHGLMQRSNAFKTDDFDKRE